MKIMISQYRYCTTDPIGKPSITAREDKKTHFVDEDQSVNCISSLFKDESYPRLCDYGGSYIWPIPWPSGSTTDYG